MTEALESNLNSRPRRMAFRTLRLLAAGGLVCGAAMLVRTHVSTISSDHAYINGAITAVRAPIGGVLSLNQSEPGVAVAAGDTLFRIENPRFGNVEAMAQVNWIRELVDRLRVELSEAELRQERQEQLFRHYEALFNDKLISRMQFMEEETKVSLSKIMTGNRREQLRAAEARRGEIEQQLVLQKEAVMPMPFNGVIWSAPAQNDSEVAAREAVLHVLDPNRVWVDAFMHEKHANKVQVGAAVVVRTLDGQEAWSGQVESVRAGTGRLDPHALVALPPGDLSRRRIAVRVKFTVPAGFTASQFFGVGRSVKVTVPSHE